MRAARVLAIVAALALPLGGVSAQASAETLADIRQEMTVLFVEIQKLRRELSTTGGAGGVAVGGSVLQRVDALEMQVQQLTAKAEQLEFRVNSVVSDGTNRLGDLEFRLCELEPGCDVGQLGQTSTLGGGAAPAVVAPSPMPTPEGPQLAVAERDDFERAKEVLATGDFRTAADLFATFAETYPGGPMTAEAHLRRGEALAGLDEKTQAARAFLEAFSTEQSGPWAPEALFRLGEKLGELGQTNEACVTLAEVGARFPGAAAVEPAQAARARFSCP